MFNLSNIFGNKKKATTPQSNFFQDLNDVGSSSKKNEEASNQNFSDLCENAINLFKKFLSDSNSNKNDLKKVADMFLKAIEMKSTKPEPYLYLAYIYYILNNNSLALKYLNIGKTLDSENKNKYLVDNLASLI